MKQQHTFLSLVFICISFISCKKFVDIDTPVDSLVSSQVFTDDNKATSVVTSIYGNMINANSFSNFTTTLYSSLLADELIRVNPNVPYQEINSNSITPSNGTISSLWSSPYEEIYYSNAAIEGISASAGVSAGTKKQLLAECKIIRALSYFYLINQYGDVPLITGTDFSINAAMGRTSTTEVYDYIVADLVSARNDLPENYITTEKVRPNKWTAAALLARIYLYRKEWGKAEVESNDIISSGLYTPLQTPNTVFLKNSKEAIWQLMPTSGLLTETQQMRPNGSTPRNYMTNQLVTSFENGDQRRQKWVDSITYQSVKYYYPGKYKNTASATVAEYYMMFRVAEQILVRAEARMEQDKLPEAISDINIIRSRAGLPNLLTTLSKSQVRVAIEKERRAEFFGEWGHRWFDLKRTGRAHDVLSVIKSNWQDTDELLPVPENEILRNINLTQNPGY